MSFSVKFNWALKINPPKKLLVRKSYSFSKPNNRIFPINVPIDLINLKREPIAKVKVTKFTQNGKTTNGSFLVLKIYKGEEKEILTQYWAENIE